MLIRKARNEAHLSQTDLARRLGVSQAAIAKLERPGSNPTVETLDSALRATGNRVKLSAEPWKSTIDETLVFEQLRVSPQRRLVQLEEMYEWGRQLTIAGARARG